MRDGFSNMQSLAVFCDVSAVGTYGGRQHMTGGWTQAGSAYLALQLLLGSSVPASASPVTGVSVPLYPLFSQHMGCLQALCTFRKQIEHRVVNIAEEPLALTHTRWFATLSLQPASSQHLLSSILLQLHTMLRPILLVTYFSYLKKFDVQTLSLRPPCKGYIIPWQT